MFLVWMHTDGQSSRLSPTQEASPDRLHQWPEVHLKEERHRTIMTRMEKQVGWSKCVTLSGS